MKKIDFQKGMKKEKKPRRGEKHEIGKLKKRKRWGRRKGHHPKEGELKKRENGLLAN